MSTKLDRVLVDLEYSLSAFNSDYTLDPGLYKKYTKMRMLQYVADLKENLLKLDNYMNNMYDTIEKEQRAVNPQPDE